MKTLILLASLWSVAAVAEESNFLALKRKSQEDGNKQEAESEKEPAVKEANEQKPKASAQNPVRPEKKKSRHVASDSEPVSTDDAAKMSAAKGFLLKDNGAEGDRTLAVNTGDECFTLAYSQVGSEIFSCTEPLPLTYTKLDCGKGTAQEIGKTRALVACDGKRTLELHFKTHDHPLTVRLQVIRQANGRRGQVTQYKVERSAKQSKFAAMLPEPELQKIDTVEEEKPLEFKFSGFTTIEFERSARYGYDVGDTNTLAARNFSNNVDHPNRSTGSFLGNFNFGLKKDQTTLQTILEVGEIYSGDSNTGGSQGGRSATVIEMRNVYLEHAITDGVQARAGLFTSVSDPRSFIYNDHTAGAQLNYNSTLFNGALWYGEAQKSRPAAKSFKRDDYLSLQANLNFLSGIKNTVFFTHRNQAGASFAQAYNDGTFSTLTGNARSLWVGGTIEYAGLEPLTIEGTFIHNQNYFTPDAPAAATDSAGSYLADLKIGTQLFSPQWGLSLEGLITPGAKNATDTSGNRVLGRRRAFASPVGAAYLMTVATNDGVDDAPGTPKQSTIGNLGLDEGIRLGLATVTYAPSKKWTFLIRGGKISTAATSAQGSTDYGSEIDLGIVRQLTPSSTITADFGTFKPGAFFQDRSPAQLLSIKYKFSF